MVASSAFSVCAQGKQVDAVFEQTGPHKRGMSMMALRGRATRNHVAVAGQPPVRSRYSHGRAVLIVKQYNFPSSSRSRRPGRRRREPPALPYKGPSHGARGNVRK